MIPDTSMPAISVIMPVYNAGGYLYAAIESILNQSFADFEFLIFDDGSEDKSISVIERYAQADSRIRVFRRAHGGHTSLLNEGIWLCRSSYIARMDADDISMPDRFQLQFDYLEKHPETVALGSSALMIDPEGSPLGEVTPPTGHAEIDKFHLSGRGGGIIHPSVVMRADILKKINGYRTELEPAEDFDLFLRLAEVGKLANLPDILLRYRHHFDRVTDKRRVDQMKMAKVVLQEMAERRGLEHVPSLPPNSERYIAPAARRQHWIHTAMSHSYYKTARKHAWELLKENMFSWTYWTLFLKACGSSLLHRHRVEG